MKQIKMGTISIKEETVYSYCCFCEARSRNVNVYTYRGADNSLARLERKQVNVSVRMA